MTFLSLGWTNAFYFILMIAYFAAYLFNDYNVSPSTHYIGKWLLIDPLVHITIGSFAYFYSNSVRDALLIPKLEPTRNSIDDISLKTSYIWYELYI